MKIRDVYGSAASGSAGSKTASRNRGGQYLRNRVTPVNPRTSRQTAIRDSFGILSSQWRALNAGTKALWETYAANTPLTDTLGQTYIMTGLQAFLQLNLSLDAIQRARVTVPPSAPVVITSTPASNSVTASAAGFITFTAGGQGTSDNQLVEMSRQVSPGRSFFGRSDYRQMGRSGNNGSATNFNGTYAAVLGSLVVGSQIAVRITPMNVTYGVRAAPYVTTIIVGA